MEQNISTTPSLSDIIWDNVYQHDLELFGRARKIIKSLIDSLEEVDEVSRLHEEAEIMIIEKFRFIIHYWNVVLECSRFFTGIYNSKVERLMALDDDTHNDGQGATAQEWKEQFNALLEVLLRWDEMLRVCLADEELKAFVDYELLLEAIGEVLSETPSVESTTSVRSAL